MVKAITLNTPTVFWWNLDANVGVRSPNRDDDVQLVQFGYFCMLNNPKNASVLTAAERTAFQSVKIGASFTGQEDDPLVVAIRAHQKSRGGAQDGHVSVAPPGQVRYDGVHSFMLNALVRSIADITKDYFPRIDKHPACQPATKLVEVVKRCCHAL